MPDLNLMSQSESGEDEGEHHRHDLRDNDDSMTAVSIRERAANRSRG